MNFNDYRPTISAEEGGRRKVVRADDINSALRDQTITLADLAKGKHGGVTVSDFGHEAPELAEGEVTPDQVGAGKVNLQELASGAKTVRFNN